MIRPFSVYLLVFAAILLIAGLFLPAGRGLSVIQFGNGQANEVSQLQAEEMGCTPVTAGDASTSRPVFLPKFESFFSTNGVLCGKSSLTMLFSGNYWWVNILLIIPSLLAFYAIFRIFIQPYARNHDKNLMLSSGLLSLVSLAIWWIVWVKFRAFPGIGFWISVIGSALIFIAGLIAPKVDAFKERHHPHPA